jgi:hypothetical protein
VTHGHGIRKDHRIWNDDLPSFLCRHDRGTRLYVGNISLDSRNTDEITQSERLLKQQQNAREEVLKNILKCETYGNSALLLPTHRARVSFVGAPAQIFDN